MKNDACFVCCAARQWTEKWKIYANANPKIKVESRSQLETIVLTTAIEGRRRISHTMIDMGWFCI